MSVGQTGGSSASTNGCSGARTRKVAPNTVSGRVVKTSTGPDDVGNRILAPSLRPIQLRCMVLIDSGHAKASRSSEQSVGVGGDAQHPLPHRAAEHREVADVAAPVGSDLLIGQHRAEPRTPVDRAVGQVREPMAIDDRMLLRSRQVRPRPAVGVGRCPLVSSSVSSAIGRARPASVSYQASKILAKIHWVQR